MIRKALFAIALAATALSAFVACIDDERLPLTFTAGGSGVDGGSSEGGPQGSKDAGAADGQGQLCGFLSGTNTKSITCPSGAMSPDPDCSLSGRTCCPGDLPACQADTCSAGVVPFECFSASQCSDAKPVCCLVHGTVTKQDTAGECGEKTELTFAMGTKCQAACDDGVALCSQPDTDAAAVNGCPQTKQACRSARITFANPNGPVGQRLVRRAGACQ